MNQWPEWTSPDGRIRLINADAFAVLPHVEADCVLTDPPYGLGDKWGDTSRPGWVSPGIKGCGRLWHGMPEWDAEPIADLVPHLLRFQSVIVWGGNYYPFPPTRAWLIWDKIQEHTGASCEMAWSNLDIPARTFRMSRVEAYCGVEFKQHPNQKPTALIEWCIGFTQAETILDPFAGSCTTAIACIRTNRRCISIEKEPKYYKIGIERCQREYDRTSLLDHAEAKAKQMELIA